MNFEIPSKVDRYNTSIKVVGIGGAGGNAIDRLIEDGLQDIETIAINTDAKDLAQTKADVKLDVDSDYQKGRGAGGDPVVAKKALEDHREDVKKSLEGADLIFIVAGEGGGTGTGGAPIVAEIAKEIGAITIAVVTKPFNYEGKLKRDLANEGIENLRDKVDSLIIISNQKALELSEEKTTVLDAFHDADRALREGVQGIADIISSAGLITVDFNDVATILKDSGSSLLGIGRGKGSDRIEEATAQAINSPLNEVSIQGSTRGLVKITAPKDLPMQEFEKANRIIASKFDPDAQIISGLTLSDDLGEDEIVVTVIASGVSPTPDVPLQANPASYPASNASYTSIDVVELSQKPAVNPADNISAYSPELSSEPSGTMQIEIESETQVEEKTEQVIIEENIQKKNETKAASETGQIPSWMSDNS